MPSLASMHYITFAFGQKVLFFSQDVVTDMYYQEQLTPSPTTAKLIGAGGVSEETLDNALSQDECNGGQQMDSTDVS